MAKIYHYTHRQQQINSDGYIRTELDLGVGKADGFDMDFVWFTQQPTISNASHSLILIASENLFGQDSTTLDRFTDALHNHAHYNTPHDHACYEFDSDTIGAVPWTRARKQWTGISPKKRKFADSIDYKSTFNGDNIQDYWVADHKVAVALAERVTTVTKTKRELLADLGIESGQDIVDYAERMVRPLVKQFPGMITTAKQQRRDQEKELDFMNELNSVFAQAL